MRFNIAGCKASAFLINRVLFKVQIDLRNLCIALKTRRPREGGDPFLLKNQSYGNAVDSRLRGNDKFCRGSLVNP
jgi:hypothetical protein